MQRVQEFAQDMEMYCTDVWRLEAAVLKYTSPLPFRNNAMQREYHVVQDTEMYRMAAVHCIIGGVDLQHAVLLPGRSSIL